MIKTLQPGGKLCSSEYNCVQKVFVPFQDKQDAKNLHNMSPLMTPVQYSVAKEFRPTKSGLHSTAGIERADPRTCRSASDGSSTCENNKVA